MSGTIQEPRVDQLPFGIDPARGVWANPELPGVFQPASDYAEVSGPHEPVELDHVQTESDHLLSRESFADLIPPLENDNRSGIVEQIEASHQEVKDAKQIILAVLHGLLEDCDATGDQLLALSDELRRIPGSRSQLVDAMMAAVEPQEEARQVLHDGLLPARSDLEDRLKIARDNLAPHLQSKADFDASITADLQSSDPEISERAMTEYHERAHEYMLRISLHSVPVHQLEGELRTIEDDRIPLCISLLRAGDAEQLARREQFDAHGHRLDELTTIEYPHYFNGAQALVAIAKALEKVVSHPDRLGARP